MWVWYTRGQIFGGSEEIRLMSDTAARRMEWGDVCSPSVALPRVSFEYFGAHGPHRSRILTP